MFSVWYLLANPINRVVVEFLPIYNPTEEEKQSPELYAKNVQKIMAEALDIPAMDISYGAQYKNYFIKDSIPQIPWIFFTNTSSQYQDF